MTEDEIKGKAEKLKQKSEKKSVKPPVIIKSKSRGKLNKSKARCKKLKVK